MKLFFCMLLLFALFLQVQGGLREESTMENGLGTIQEDETVEIVRDEKTVEFTLCRSRRYSGNGRKLLMEKLTTTTTTMKEEEEQRRADRKTKVSSSEMVDVDGMDYSDARRKPPIHN